MHYNILAVYIIIVCIHANIVGIYLNENGRLAAQYAEDILAMHENMLTQVKALDRLSRTLQRRIGE